MIKVAKQAEEATAHLAWCDRRCCRGIGHIGREFRVAGDVPLLLELFQTPADEGPRLSILEQHGSGLVTISADQSLALIRTLTRMPIPQA